MRSIILHANGMLIKLRIKVSGNVLLSIKSFGCIPYLGLTVKKHNVVFFCCLFFTKMLT